MLINFRFDTDKINTGIYHNIIKVNKFDNGCIDSSLSNGERMADDIPAIIIYYLKAVAKGKP